MKTVINSKGETVKLRDALVLMDDELFTKADSMMHSDQTFFRFYCLLHRSKFGEEFIFA